MFRPPEIDPYYVFGAAARFRQGKYQGFLNAACFRRGFRSCPPAIILSPGIF